MRSLLPDSAFWAKLGEGPSWHPLVAHSADVAAVVGRLLQEDSVLGSRLARLAGMDRLSGHLKSLLTFMAALHDLGKANHGFQERRHERPRIREGHVQVVFRSLDDERFLGVIREALEPGFNEGLDPYPLFAATIAHHGRPFERHTGVGGEFGQYWMPDRAGSGRDPLAEIRRLAMLARRWSGLTELGPIDAFPIEPRFNHLFAGMLTLADWIGSTEAAFPFAPSADDDPERYWDAARERADLACRQIGVVSWRPTAVGAHGGLYSQMFPDVFGGAAEHRPNPLQELIAHLPLQEQAPRILIEAATGSGKTEAALALYARMRSQGRVGGLMFALPTRATARAMHERIEAALPGLYGEDVPEVTLAVGGHNPQPHSQTGALQRAPNMPDEDDAGIDPGSLLNWASSSAKKFLAAEVVVGTVDQALLAVLAVKHSHLRLAGLSRHLLVVDEVHSHDRYMLEVLGKLLDFHTSAGGAAVLMSATVSAAARGLLCGVPDTSTLKEAVNTPFPTVAEASSGAPWTFHDLEDHQGGGATAWTLASEEGGLTRAVEAAKAGARVCVLRNLVTDARKTVERLAGMGAGSFLWRPPGSTWTPSYHAQYAHPDRTHLDRAVLAAFGKGGDQQSGCILVATQVVEQSLDVDFDLLVSDLAPMEVLIQRIGRLHRHAARTPHRPNGYRSPEAIVIGPDGPFRPKVEPRGNPHGWGTVYENLPALELTRRVIEQRPQIELPGDSRRLIEDVYHSERMESLRSEQGWDRVINAIEGRGMTHRLIASDSTLDFDRNYPENANRFQSERRIRTRLGDDTLRIALVPSAPCWFAVGQEAANVDLSVAKLRDFEFEDARNPQLHGRINEDGVAEYQLGERVVRYEPTGWRVTG